MEPKHPTALFQNKIVATRIGSLIIALSAVIGGSLVWWSGVSYEAPELTNIPVVVSKIATNSGITFPSDPPSATQSGMLFFENKEVGYSLEYPVYVKRRDSGGWSNNLEWPFIPQNTWAQDGRIDSYRIPSIGIEAYNIQDSQNIVMEALPFIDPMDTIPPSISEISFLKNKNGVEYALFYATLRPTTYQDGSKIVTGKDIKIGPYVIVKLLDLDGYLIFDAGESITAIEPDGSTPSRFWNESVFPSIYKKDLEVILESIKLEHPSIEQLAGIGAYLNVATNGDIVVDSVLVHSVAEKNGIEGGDHIISVNGSSVSGLGIDSVVSMIRGAVGTTVEIVVKKKNGEEHSYKMIRGDMSSVGLSLRERIERDLQH
jgi:hypothetical protein